MQTDLDWVRRLDPMEKDAEHKITVPDPAWARKQVVARHRNGKRSWTVTGTVAAVAVMACLVLVAVPSSSPAPVRVTRSGRDGLTVAINQAEATATDLAEAFAKHHLDVSVRLVPVSPSEVGRVLTADGPGAVTVRPVATPRCPIGSPTCPITLSIGGISGHASVIVGRAARPGERYASSASVFARNEVLHCSGVFGEPVSDAKRYLSTHHLIGIFREQQPPGPAVGTPSSSTSTSTSGTADAAASGRRYVVAGEALSQREVLLWVSSVPPSASERASADAGCQALG